MISLIALLLACGAPDGGTAADPATTPDGTDPVTHPDGTVPVTGADGEEVPMYDRGLRTLDPAEVAIRIDALSARCTDSEAAVVAETVGPADSVQVDLLAADGSVVAVAMTPRTQAASAVWHRFDGAIACDRVEGATWVVRAQQGSDKVDCTVHGAEADDALAGSWDAALVDAGRPTLADCHGM